jgi:hypothetical protein
MSGGAGKAPPRGGGTPERGELACVRSRNDESDPMLPGHGTGRRTIPGGTTTPMTSESRAGSALTRSSFPWLLCARDGLAWLGSPLTFWMHAGDNWRRASPLAASVLPHPATVFL